MAGADALFQFIKTLTKSEKRYFKLYAATHRKQSNVLKLFDVIAQQKQYDEKQVLARFGGKAFLKQLSVTKVQLRKLMLKSLESYHASADVDSTLQSHFRQIKILYDKGLYHQSQKFIVKAKTLAEKHEKFELLLELLRWERNITFVYPQSDYFQKRETIYNEQCAAAKKLQNTNEYRRLADKIFLLSKREEEARSDETLQAYANLMRHPLLQDENKAMTKEAKLSFYFMHSVFYEKSGNAERCYDCRKKIVELLEASPAEIDEKPYIYLFSINNLVLACQNSSKQEELLDALKKMRTIPQLLGKKCPQDMKVKIFERSYAAELNLYGISCQFEKAMALIPDIEKGLEEFKGKITKERGLILYFNSALLYFIRQDYHKALAWNNKIINDITFDRREDIYCNARMLNLLIHYELGNEVILETLVKSSARYLDKKNRLYKTETAFLDFIRKKIPAAFTGKERVAAFKALKAELEEITKDPFEKNAMKDLDYIAWVESKIEGKPFAEVLRGK